LLDCGHANLIGLTNCRSAAAALRIDSIQLDAPGRSSAAAQVRRAALWSDLAQGFIDPTVLHIDNLIGCGEKLTGARPTCRFIRPMVHGTLGTAFSSSFRNR
jgi:hypothetical protein